MRIDSYAPDRKTLSFTQFRALVLDATEFSDPDDYLIECGGAVTADYSTESIITLLRLIYTYAHSGLAGLRDALDLSRISLSNLTGIPLRTLENWDAATRKAPSYAAPLIAYVLLAEFGII